MIFNTFSKQILSKYKTNYNYYRYFSITKCDGPPWRVLFFGTDEFSIFSLRALFKECRSDGIIEKLEVCTVVNNKKNSVLKFADENNLNVHKWPSEVPDGFHAGLVVSFGHLIPENIINKFPLGMLNVHASLLPRWRGAAPIVYAIAKGDTETGITIMKIKPKKFDIGEIIFQEKIPLLNHVKMPEVHKILGELGAKNLIKCLRNMPNCLEHAAEQNQQEVTFAPKIDVNFANINWQNMTSIEIYNLDRAVTGVFPLSTTFNNKTIKLLNISIQSIEVNVENSNFSNNTGSIQYDKKSKCIKVRCKDGNFICVEKIGIVGKKVMSATDFNNGFLKKENESNRFFK